jgi:hypothetical protein
MHTASDSSSLRNIETSRPSYFVETAAYCHISDKDARDREKIEKELKLRISQQLITVPAAAAVASS